MKNSDKTLIFFIDDEPMSNIMNSTLIQRLHPDVEVKTFTNGKDALDDLKNLSLKKPELIFLDLNMPEMSGWTFMEEFKKTGLDIEVVILTSSTDLTDIEKAENEKQIKEYMIKPLNINTFKDFIKRFFKIMEI
ncbi:MAG TPA: response regulator [Cytophagaceae bacterium]